MEPGIPPVGIEVVALAVLQADLERLAGLPVESGRHLVLADEPQAFATAVIDLLFSHSTREAMGRAAAKLVREKFDWSVVIPEVEAAY